MIITITIFVTYIDNTNDATVRIHISHIPFIYILIVVRNLLHRVFEHHNNAFLSRNASYVTQYFYLV